MPAISTRAIVHGVLRATLALTYVVAVVAVVLSLGVLFGRASSLATAIGTLVVAAVLWPVMRRGLVAVDRRFSSNRRRMQVS